MIASNQLYEADLDLQEQDSFENSSSDSDSDAARKEDPKRQNKLDVLKWHK